MKSFKVSAFLGGLKHFLCSPVLGEMIQFDEHIFSNGWLNHQLVLKESWIIFQTFLEECFQRCVFVFG